jgi:hypothetical protein
MIQLLPAYADGVFATWDQNLVSLRELRLEQAIKCISDMDSKWVASGMRLSHAF